MACSCRLFGLFLSLVGLSLSAYTYYVELKMEEDSGYEALCDIDATFSCTKVFNSSYARGFGLVEKVAGADHWLNQPNPVYGFAFYSVIIILGLCEVGLFVKLQVAAAFISNLSSVYLGYVLLYVIEAVCVVCCAVYTVNFLILVSSLLRLRAYRRAAAGASRYQVK